MKHLLENWRKYRAPVLLEAIDPITIDKIESAIMNAGGEPYIVGGAVRDELLPDTPPSKDVDFLVRNLELHQIVVRCLILEKLKKSGKLLAL